MKVLAVINPQSFREFVLDEFDDSRIPLWMVNLTVPIGDDSLRFLWIPDIPFASVFGYQPTDRCSLTPIPAP